jgi:hypothetical protein
VVIFGTYTQTTAVKSAKTPETVSEPGKISEKLVEKHLKLVKNQFLKIKNQQKKSTKNSILTEIQSKGVVFRLKKPNFLHKN